MKNKIMILFIVMLLSLLSVNAAPVDCSTRGNVVLTLEKPSFQQGEAIQGKVSVFNNDQKDSAITYFLTIINNKDGKSPWTLTTTKTVPPGNSTYGLSQLFRAGVPSEATIGIWTVEFNAAMDYCTWQNIERFGVFSCSDKVLNGDEEGVDCGGSCSNQCKTNVNIQQSAGQQPQQDKPDIASYVVQSLPFQLPKNFLIYLGVGILLFMVIIGSSILYWRRRARFSKFY